MFLTVAKIDHLETNAKLRRHNTKKNTWEDFFENPQNTGFHSFVIVDRIGRLTGQLNIEHLKRWHVFELLKREIGSCFSFVLKLVQVDKIMNHDKKNEEIKPFFSSDFCIQIIFGGSFTCVPLALWQYAQIFCGSYHHFVWRPIRTNDWAICCK